MGNSTYNIVDGTSLGNLRARGIFIMEMFTMLKVYKSHMSRWEILRNSMLDGHTQSHGGRSLCQLAPGPAPSVRRTQVLTKHPFRHYNGRIPSHAAG